MIFNLINKKLNGGKGRAAIKIYCIKKIRDNKGTIIEYVMGDEHGDTGSFDRAGVIKLLKDKQYDVVNLQLDTMGRIVDKAIPNEEKVIDQINKRSQSNDICVLFDRAYGFIQKMGMINIYRDPSGKIELSEPFDKINGNVNIDELQSKFENYVLSKYKVQLTKIDVTNIMDNSRFIQYGLQYVEDTYLNEDRFKRIDSICNYKVSCNANPNTHQVIKKVTAVKDNKTGRVINDAFMGIIVYDKRDGKAVDWTRTRNRELENKIKRLNKDNNGKAGGGGTLIDKSKPNFLEKALYNSQALHGETKFDRFMMYLGHRVFRHNLFSGLMKLFSR